MMTPPSGKGPSVYEDDEKDSDDYFSHSPTSGTPLGPIAESTTTTINVSTSRLTSSPLSLSPKFRLEDYVYILSSLQHRNPTLRNRKKELKKELKRSVIPPTIKHDAEDSEVFVPALHSLASLCVHKPSKGNVAVAFAIGGRIRRRRRRSGDSADSDFESPHVRKSTVYVAQSCPVSVSVEEHLKRIWSHMRRISSCLEERKKPSPARFCSWGSNSRRLVKRTPEGRKLRDELVALEKTALSFCMPKMARRVLKRWEVFDKFVEGLKKDRTRGDVPKGTSTILINIRNALEPVVKQLQRKNNNTTEKDIHSELTYAERTWKESNAAISEDTFAVINDAAARFSSCYTRRSVVPVYLTDVRRYIDKIFLVLEHCRVLEELVYSWNVVDVLSGELDVVRVEEQYKDVDNLPTTEDEMRELIRSACDGEENVERYLRHLRKYPLLNRGGVVRVNVHYECNLISYIHRHFAVPPTTTANSSVEGDSEEPTSPMSTALTLTREKEKNTPFPYIGVSKTSCDMCRRYISFYNSHQASDNSTPAPSPLFNKTFLDSTSNQYNNDSIDVRGLQTWTCPVLSDPALESTLRSSLISAVMTQIRELQMPDDEASPSYDGAGDAKRGSFMSKLTRFGSFSGMIPGVRKGSYTSKKELRSGTWDVSKGEKGFEGKKPMRRNMSLSFEVGSGKLGFFGRRTPSV